MKDKGGRPTKMDRDTLNKLEDVFIIGGSDIEACLNANISPKTLYNYQKENPKFLHRKNILKETPVLKARQTVINSLDDPNFAFKYLEKKKKDEFGNRLILEGAKEEEDKRIDKIEEILKLSDGTSD